ncbi:hypothetical protein C8J57DRAFT_259322 [Mycena rebaudengoi]|nr:hypothetical protein C8J57DRAFT_259322 [Mycena rebaudengoi]
MLDPGTIALKVRSAFRRRRNEGPTTGALRDMVLATVHTMNATLHTAPNDTAIPASIGGSGDSGAEANDDASPHSAGHARSGSSEGREANSNATLPSGSGRLEGHAHTDGRDGNDGAQAQYFTIVINIANTGGIGGPGGAGLSVGGRGGDGGGARMLGVPPPNPIHSTGDTSLGRALFGGDGVTGEDSVIGDNAVQEQVSRLTPPPLLAHPTHIIDDASLRIEGEHNAPGEGTVIDVPAQTTTTRSSSTPPPLPVDDASMGTVGGHGETGEGPVIDV